MPAKKSRTEKQRKIIRKQAATTIIEEVERFEDLGPRMHQLLLTSLKGTRIYLRVRDQRTLHLVTEDRRSSVLADQTARARVTADGTTIH